MWGRLAATSGTIYIQSVIIIQPITSLIDRVIIDVQVDFSSSSSAANLCFNPFLITHSFCYRLIFSLFGAVWSWKPDLDCLLLNWSHHWSTCKHISNPLPGLWSKRYLRISAVCSVGILIDNLQPGGTWVCQEEHRSQWDHHDRGSEINPDPELAEPGSEMCRSRFREQSWGLIQKIEAALRHMGSRMKADSEKHKSEFGAWISAAAGGSSAEFGATIGRVSGVSAAVLNVFLPPSPPLFFLNGSASGAVLPPRPPPPPQPPPPLSPSPHTEKHTLAAQNRLFYAPNSAL